jgi:hypothetical protein
MFSAHIRTEVKNQQQKDTGKFFKYLKTMPYTSK